MSGSLARSDRDDVARARTDGALETLVGYNLKRAYMLFQTDFRETMGDDGLTPRSFSALSLVVERPGITQSDVSRCLGIERSGLVAMIDDLERRGHLRRVPVPGDRRVQALQATPDGCAAYDRMLAEVRAHEARVLATLDADERETLVTLLRKLRTARKDQGE